MKKQTFAPASNTILNGAFIVSLALATLWLAWATQVAVRPTATSSSKAASTQQTAPSMVTEPFVIADTPALYS